MGIRVGGLAGGAKAHVNSGVCHSSGMEDASKYRLIDYETMHHDSNIRLSLCMIVKDEAAMLPAFLAKVQGLWDELVVVDTGSQDETVAILEAAGAKVLHRAWQNDFALARNFSLDAASGEWILFLDPDEHVSPVFVGQARALLVDASAGAATVVMQNYREDGHLQEASLVRMFRRHPDVRFRHAIHEDLADTLMPRLEQTGQVIAHLSAPIMHLGYDRAHAQARGKKVRDTSIIEAVLASDPDDLYLHYKLMEQARFWGDPALAARAAPAAMSAFDRAPDSALGHWAGELAVMMVDGLTAGRPQEAVAALEALWQRVPDSPAVAYRMGELLESMNQWAAAAAAFEKAMKAPGPLINTQMRTVRPLMGLVRIGLATQNMDAAIGHLKSARELDPRDSEVEFTVGMLLGA